MKLLLRQLMRLLALLLVCALALQLYFLARIALMRFVDPSSTTFQRTQAVRILQRQGQLPWHQTWQPLSSLGRALPRTVLASEDASFFSHGGIDWDAVDKARDRNERKAERARGAAKLVGGSTITQQLAKNLFLSGERTYERKAQEAALTLALEALLGKERILEIYLNSVEWGEGVFGAQAASRHYFRRDAADLNLFQAARLAVMLPAPRRFERNPNSDYLLSRAETIAARAPAVRWPLDR